MRKSSVILLSMIAVYLVFLVSYFSSWFEARNMEDKIANSLHQFLSSKCKADVRIHWVKIEQIPSGFMTLGEDSQSWSAEYTSDRTNMIKGYVDQSVLFEFTENICSRNNASDNLEFQYLNLDKSTFTPNQDKSTITGEIGPEETDSILLKFFAFLMVIVYLIALMIDIANKKYKRKNGHSN